jgi:hypothetical protein
MSGVATGRDGRPSERDWPVRERVHVDCRYNHCKAEFRRKCGSGFLKELQTAQDLHQIVNLASNGGPIRFKVLLHTQAREER